MEIINKDNIFLNVDLKDKDKALKFIAEKAQELGITTSYSAYYKALALREKEATTGFGYGIAIPHGKIQEIKNASIIVVKLKNEINWEALDDKPIKIIIALAVSEKEAGTTHLRLLSEIAKKLMHEDFREDIFKADDKNKIISLLNIK